MWNRQTRTVRNRVSGRQCALPRRDPGFLLGRYSHDCEVAVRAKNAGGPQSQFCTAFAPIVQLIVAGDLIIALHSNQAYKNITGTTIRPPEPHCVRGGGDSGHAEGHWGV